MMERHELRNQKSHITAGSGTAMNKKWGRTFAQLFFHPHCGAFGCFSVVTVTPGNFPSKTKVKLLGSFCYNDYEGNMNVKKPIGFNKQHNNFACAACFLVQTLSWVQSPRKFTTFDINPLWLYEPLRVKIPKEMA